MAMRFKVLHRDFVISVVQSPVSGNWTGMAKGLGTVVLGRNHAIAGDEVRYIRSRIDTLYRKQLGVFAGR